MLSPVPPSIPFTVPNGGTGLATIPADRLMLGDGTNAVKSMVNGTASQYVGFSGAGSTPQATSFPAATSGNRTAGASFSSFAGNGVYSVATDGSGNIGVTLPSAGTYDVQLFCRAIVAHNTGVNSSITAQLYNQTAGAVVDTPIGGATTVSFTAIPIGSGGFEDNTVVVPYQIAVAVATTLVVRVARDGATSYAANLTNCGLTYRKALHA